ncbi:MAG: 3-deoxy-7-phosphoheptulonate synthase [Deltaproteobacteria bacterium]|nr:3-deoxy-7-phosphoheptulonate synthase [Deltaproteobacteria bacterium]
MIVVMKVGAAKRQVDAVTQGVTKLGFKPHVIHGEDRIVIACIGHEKKKSDLYDLQSLDGVDSVVPISKPYKLASRETRKEPSVIKVTDTISVGGKQICVMAGPCSVESETQLMETARAVKKAGAQLLRGGAFKPRTSPYEFQGLEEEGLKILAKARKETGLPIITEVMGPEDVELVDRYADVLQVGARNVQNFSLLKELGKLKKPVFLKRGMSTTIREWLLSAEYILTGGNSRVILCERGIRTFETSTRNTLDLNAIPVVKGQTHLPIVVDPSHGTGNWSYVIPMALAGIAAGADGIMVEVHPNPEVALSDGGQSLTFKRFEELMEKLSKIAQAVGRTL